MSSKGEYDAAFNSEIDSIMAFPADAKVDVMKHAAEARRRIVRKRDEFTRGISKAWKDGYALLKAENDRMQKDLAQSFREAHGSIDAVTGDKIEGLQR